MTIPDDIPVDSNTVPQNRKSVYLDDAPPVVMATSAPASTSGVIYGVGDTPPWYLCILLGFQHYLTAFGSTITVPLVIAPALCVDEDTVGLSEIISTIFFVSGLATILQTTLGTRLPIIQGATFAFLTPTFSILSLKRWECPYTVERETDPSLLNSTLPEPGSDEHREMWQLRLREIQGAIMVASIFQVVIGFTGLMGLVLRFIGPLAITPTIALIGIALFEAAADKASAQWYIAFMTMFLIALFSQYMRNIKIPCCTSERGKGCTTTRMPIFSLFPVLLAMVLSWVICVILTAAGAFPEDKKAWGYYARTDIKTDVLYKSEWFRFPYPGQWGMPTVSTAAVFGMLAGVLSSMIESVGDYFACARLAGAPPPPVHAVNRGIGVEGICCILAGAWGSGNGTTSYSENVGAIGITKVGGVIMIVLGCLGKFGALFVTIPDPVVGGMFMIMFGSEIADQIISVLLGTSMFVGGMTGFILDNTIPGTDDERGLTKWRQHGDGTGNQEADMSIYDLPLIQPYLDKIPLFRYLPFCPRFTLSCGHGGSEERPDAYNVNDVESQENFHDNKIETDRL
ncbi:S23A2-like protein [Mya arenaria]|uniref:S23A2-like protein n=1 Tax=Mya arenaria TaxID=6604 RepID=A0ABY7D9C4_MYAAR|nr:S23A2-like protein [Mya arenaria]